MDAIISDPVKYDEMWKICDFNGNGGSTLAEIDKMVIMRFPLLNNKSALMRAYKRAISRW